MPESAATKVKTTIRFDAELHNSLNDFVHESGKGLPPKSRPSKDSIVQDAVELYLAQPKHTENGPSATKEVTAIQGVMVDQKYRDLVAGLVEFLENPPKLHSDIARRSYRGVVDVIYHAAGLVPPK